MQLVKPHGSASWLMRTERVIERLWVRRSGSAVIEQRDVPMDRRTIEWQSPGGEPLYNAMPEEDVEALRKEPLVLGAVPIKSELLSEVQELNNAAEVYHLIQDQWHGVVTAIAAASLITVAGYSFPKEDQYGRFLMQEGVRQRRPGTGKVDVEFYELDGRPRELCEENIREVFGESLGKPIYCGSVLAGSPPAGP